MSEVPPIAHSNRYAVAMNFGRYNRSITSTSSGDQIDPAAWPPPFVPEQGIGGATGQIGWNNSSWSYPHVTGPGGSGFPISPGTPPSPAWSTMFQRQVAMWVFDTRNADVEAMPHCNLYLHFSEGNAGGWIFSIPEGQLTGPNTIAESGHIWGNTTTIDIDWVGGMQGGLPPFGSPDIYDPELPLNSIFLEKAAQWPFTGDGEGEDGAASFDMLEYVEPNTETNISETDITIPLNNWRYWIENHDWVGLVFSIRQLPEVFWGWQDVPQFMPDATPYIGRNWVGFNSSSFLLVENPLWDVAIDMRYKPAPKRVVPVNGDFQLRMKPFQISSGLSVYVDHQHRILNHRAVLDRVN
jgi:hypothetical protein